MSPIVMVHGAFVGGWSFEWFQRPFKKHGFQVHAPDLRGHGANEPRDKVIGVSMRDYARDIVSLCRSLDEPPILVGHSMGGLVAQMAARKVKAQALVLLAPSPPWGLVSWTVDEAVAAFGAQMATLLSNGAIDPSREVMRHMSLQRMTPQEAAPILARLRPESARAVRETVNWWLDPFMTTSIGPGPLPMPSLVISGEDDRVNPPATGRMIAERIGGEFVGLPQMSHWLLSEPGWKDVVEAVLEWLPGEKRAAA
ncbi:MAG: hydrolase, alpha/beta hydrolase fold family [Phenylobacterium sp.]|nr:hydrolase, alpha/beta hydrolase fold family [Phenylobacterium sp.]